MTIDQIDAAIRMGAVTTFLLLAWVVFLNRRPKNSPEHLFLPLAICLAGFVMGNTPIPLFRMDGALGAIASMASGFTVVFLWWFCLSCFDRSFAPRRAILLVGIAWAVLAAVDRGMLGITFSERGLVYVLLALGFGIVAHLIWRLIGERQGDLVRQRYEARVVVSIVLGGMLLIDLAADVLFGIEWRPLAFSMTQNVVILAFGLWLSAKLLKVRDGVFTFSMNEDEGIPIPVHRELQGVPDPEIHRRLRILMEHEHLFLDPQLTFAVFVKRMSASERAVRQLINHELGYDHFRVFLNHYRVAEARRLLAIEDAKDKLVTIAMDSGFASLASFNRAFRSIEGCTPSEYRAALRHGEGQALARWKARF